LVGVHVLIIHEMFDKIKPLSGLFDKILLGYATDDATVGVPQVLVR